jgi:hypothetical protein
MSKHDVLFTPDIHSHIQVFLDAHDRSYFVRVSRGAKFLMAEIAFSSENGPTTKQLEKMKVCRKITFKMYNERRHRLADLVNCRHLTLMGSDTFSQSRPRCYHAIVLPPYLQHLVIGEDLVLPLFHYRKDTNVTVTYVEIQSTLHSWDLQYLECFPQLEHLRLAEIDYDGVYERHDYERHTQMLKIWRSKKCRIEFFVNNTCHIFNWQNEANNHSVSCKNFEGFVFSVLTKRIGVCILQRIFFRMHNIKKNAQTSRLRTFKTLRLRQTQA